MNKRWLNKINITFAFGLLIILTIGGISYVGHLRLNDYNNLVIHTNNVLTKTKAVLSNFQDIETGMRGYVITGNSRFLEPYNDGLSRMDSDIEVLSNLTADNPRQQMRVGQLKVLKDTVIERTRGLVDLREKQGLVVAVKKVSNGEGKKLMDQIRDIVKMIEDEEHALLTARVFDANKYSKITTSVILAGILSAIFLILLAILILNRQIGEIKKAELIVQQLNFNLSEKVTALETSNKELESFSYSVSHDLRAPLRAMIGFSTVILEDHGETLVSEVKENLTRVVSATKKMGQLIDGLLDLSRLTRRELVSENVDLSVLADSILKDLQMAEPQRQVSFEVTKGLVVRGDSRLLHAALSNLLNNAWKFTKISKEAKIEFGSMRGETHKTYFVKDNGVGFDMIYANKLFGIFQRLHSSAEYEGTGIGLATVQRIIQRHGGKIWVESEVNKGTTFHFTI